jgi:hypothetical protein
MCIYQGSKRVRHLWNVNDESCRFLPLSSPEDVLPVWALTRLFCK